MAAAVNIVKTARFALHHQRLVLMCSQSAHEAPRWYI